MLDGASPMTIKNPPIAFRYDSSVIDAPFVKERLNHLRLSMSYAGFKAKISGADLGKLSA